LFNTTNTDIMTSKNSFFASEKLWFARFVGVGNVNANNARGKGNRAARRAGWYVHDKGWWSRNTK